MLRAKADRAEGDLIMKVAGRLSLLTFALEYSRLFELRPGFLCDADT
jgi:hypothetical protein